MALVKCPDCGGEVSDKAKACPRCGRRMLKKSSGMGCFLLLLIVLIIFVVKYVSSPDEKVQPVIVESGGLSSAYPSLKGKLFFVKDKGGRVVQDKFENLQNLAEEWKDSLDTLMICRKNQDAFCIGRKQVDIEMFNNKLMKYDSRDVEFMKDKVYENTYIRRKQ